MIYFLKHNQSDQNAINSSMLFAWSQNLPKIDYLF